MAKSLKSMDYKNFSTGLNTIDSTLDMEDSDLLEADNVDFSVTGEAYSIDGLTQVGNDITVNGSPSTKVLGSIIFNGTRYCMASNGTEARLQYLVGSTWTEANSQNFDPDANVEFDVYNTNLFFVNGLETNGNVLNILSSLNVLSGVATSSGLEIGMTEIILHNERIFIGKGNKVFISRMYPQGDEYDWDASTVYSGADTAGFIQLDNNTEDYIQAFVQLYGELMIFRKDSIYTFTGGVILQAEIIKRTNSKIGAIAPRSVSGVDERAYFFSSDGIKTFNGVQVEQGTTQIIDRKIRNLTDGFSNKGDVVSVYFDDRYYISDRSGIVFVYNELTRGWSKWTGIDVDVFCRDDFDVYCFSGNKYYKLNSNSSSSITSSIKTKNFDLEQKNYYKMFEKLVGTFKSRSLTSDVTIYWYIDGADSPTGSISISVPGSSTIWDSGYLWDSGFKWDTSEISFSKAKKRKLKSGISISFKIEATGTNRFNFDSINIIYELLRKEL